MTTVLQNRGGRGIAGNTRRMRVERAAVKGGAEPKRARYNSALMDANALKSGENFSKLRDTYVIIITENDVMKRGKDMYVFDRVDKDDGLVLGDGTHIICVNGAITVGTLNVTGAMRLEGDMTVTGEIVFAEGASLVTTGALNINGATARYTGVMSGRSLVLASAEGTGSISGTPAAVDLGANRGYRLNVGGNRIKISRPGFVIIVK